MAAPANDFIQFVANGGFISVEQADRVREESSRSRESIVAVMRRLQLVPENVLLEQLSDFHGVPYLELEGFLVDHSSLELLPVDVVRSHHVVPLFVSNQNLSLGIADPTNTLAIDAVRSLTHLEVDPVLCSEEALEKAIEQYYGDTTKSGEHRTSRAPTEPEWMLQKMGGDETAPIISIVNAILDEAIKNRASDIHIEPQEKVLRIRFRVDGVLRDIPAPPKSMQNAITSRVKVMSNLDISETRLPQDGRFERLLNGQRRVDVRVSTFPTIYGENVVLRLLDHGDVLRKLEELGLSPENQKVLDSIIRLPHGILLVTGPTGSGKTTTLYSILQILNKPEVHIVTVEDPVEYQLPGIRQCQVNSKIGLTFSSGLRSILRQDPDIILVGEIRDKETAEIAIHSALTGHLVLSTLHTNDAASAPTRLIDMGVEPFLIASSLVGVLAQRLVRLLCLECREKYQIASEQLESIGFPKETGRSIDNITLYRGKGCRSCQMSGYTGRSGIFELMTVSDDIREHILKKSPSHTLKNITQEKGMPTLREDGFRKVVRWETSLEEVLRATELD